MIHIIGPGDPGHLKVYTQGQPLFKIITMETNTSRFLDKAINGLRTAAVELEEFQLQVALGKAEAAETYEEVKKKFMAFIHETGQKLNGGGKALVSDLIGKLGELYLQLQLGKAESKEVFNEQKHAILKIMQEIENLLQTTDIGMEIFLKLNGELKKFRIKMDILELRFELGKLNVKEKFDTHRADFSKNIERLKTKFTEKEQDLEQYRKHFCTEVNEAYGHIRKAFSVSEAG
jgi:hypothetical protein